MPRVYDDVLHCIGETPSVRLNRLTAGMPGTLYAKAEFLNRR